MPEKFQAHDPVADATTIPLIANCLDWAKHHKREIEAIDEVDGKPKRMTFINNNFIWSASSIYDLYKERWGH